MHFCECQGKTLHQRKDDHLLKAQWRVSIYFEIKVCTLFFLGGTVNCLQYSVNITFTYALGTHLFLCLSVICVASWAPFLKSRPDAGVLRGPSIQTGGCLNYSWPRVSSENCLSCCFHSQPPCAYTVLAQYPQGQGDPLRNPQSLLLLSLCSSLVSSIPAKSWHFHFPELCPSVSSTQLDPVWALLPALRVVPSQGLPPQLPLVRDEDSTACYPWPAGCCLRELLHVSNCLILEGNVSSS